MTSQWRIVNASWVLEEYNSFRFEDATMNKKTYIGGFAELFVETIVGMDYLREAIETLAESITHRDMDEP
jgi:lysozyme family protein